MRSEKLQKRGFSDQMAPLMELLAGALRSGQSLNQALSSAADEMPFPASQYLATLVQKITLGAVPESAVDELALEFKDSPCASELRMFSTAVAVTRSSGGNLAEILSGLAETLRERQRLRAEIAALTAQGRMSGWIVGLLPLLILATLSVMDPELVAPMFHTTTGLILLAAGLVLELLGLWLIRRIVRIDL